MIKLAPLDTKGFHPENDGLYADNYGFYAENDGVSPENDELYAENADLLISNLMDIPLLERVGSSDTTVRFSI